MMFMDADKLSKIKLSRTLINRIGELSESYKELDYPEVAVLREGKLDNLYSLYSISQKLGQRKSRKAKELAQSVKAIMADAFPQTPVRQMKQMPQEAAAARPRFMGPRGAIDDPILMAQEVRRLLLEKNYDEAIKNAKNLNTAEAANALLAWGKRLHTKGEYEDALKLISSSEEILEKTGSSRANLFEPFAYSLDCATRLEETMPEKRMEYANRLAVALKSSTQSESRYYSDVLHGLEGRFLPQSYSYLEAMVETQFALSKAKDEKLREIMTPELLWLLEGNKRFAAGKPVERDLNKERMDTLEGQHPMAAVLCCSDSRVPPEHIFDAGVGDLFVNRTAGNVLGDATIGSIEYAAVHLDVPLIVIMGHDKCGAVKAAWNPSSSRGHEEPRFILKIVSKITPSVEKTRQGNGDFLDAVRENVKSQAAQLLEKSDACRKLVEEGKLRIVTLNYHHEGGKVDLVL